VAEETSVQIVLPDDASPELIERVQAAFPEAMPAAAEPLDAPEPVDQLAAAEQALADAVAGADELPGRLGAWFADLPGGGLWFLGLMALVFVLAYGVERGAMLAWPRFKVDREPEESFRKRLPRALRHFVGRLVALLVFAIAATALARLILPALDFRTRIFARETLDAIFWARTVYAFFATLTAPEAPGRRAMGFTDAEATRARDAIFAVVWAIGAIGVLRVVLSAAAEGGPADDIAVLFLIVLNGVASAAFFLRVQAPVAALIARGAGEGGLRGWFGGLARNWAWVYVAVIALDVLLKMMGSLGLLGATARGTGPSIFILTVTPLVLAALILWREEAGLRRGAWPGLFALIEGALIVGAAVALLGAWGIDPFAPPVAGAGPLARLLPGLVEATMIAVVGLALTRAAIAVLGGGAKAEEGALVDEENVQGATRIDTILPILRGFAIAAIAVVTALMALSALGVDTAPLLAGAGVLGLAIGFGAQRLVSDVISGLFYLYEDAFRVGEYIETGSGKGVVETISLRSVRLRHHRGPVFTIPFSDMGTIQNHSRDWVKIKFTFLVPSDTDVEMVRKLVKKVGQQLEEDPELDGKFLEPLKSQGAIGIRGRAYEIGCKFTSRPGQQFLIRRKAYAALQKALAEKDIDLFAPQLTLSQDDPSTPVLAGPDGQPQPAPA